MSGNPELFTGVLSSLRAQVGDIEFGYRAQGLFAQVLRRVGGNVREIRHQGHPDIIADLDGRVARFEVEIASAHERNHVIKSDDLTSIKPVNDADAGFLAILDSAHPVRWAVISYGRLRTRLGRCPLVTLHAIADLDLSERCTNAFTELLFENSQKLEALTFHLLCDRVLRGVGG